MLAMRPALLTVLPAFVVANAAAQGVTVTGDVLLKEGGQPLGFTTVSILSDNRQLLTNESGKFLLLGLAPGEVRLRFKRIGFAPKDTTLRLAANDSAKLRIEMTRLFIQLPAMVVSGKCTNETPLQARSSALAELFEQVTQNAERVKLLAAEKPFFLYVFRVDGFLNRDNKIVPQTIDTVIRRALPPTPYRPKEVIRRSPNEDSWVMSLPEVPDLADTAFTNNHCFHYAGQTRWETDSVVKVDFEPVPWLDKEVDIKGSLYLKVDGYQLVASTAMLNRIPAQLRAAQLTEVSVRAKFTEFVSGIPVLDEWELTKRYRSPVLPRVELGQVFNLKWVDSTAMKVDTLRLLPRPR